MPSKEPFFSFLGRQRLSKPLFAYALLVIASPPVLVAILPGLGSGEDLCAWVENWAVAIGIPIAGPRGLLILKQPVVAIGHLVGLARRLAQHDLPHDLDWFTVR